MKTILIVDDEEILLEYLSSLFEAQGCQTLCAKSGRSAMLQMKQNPQIDLVISDVQMPDGDGFWLLNEIQCAHPQVPVIMLTAVLRETANQLLLQGAWKIYSKPMEEEAVVSIIASIETSSA